LNVTSGITLAITFLGVEIMKKTVLILLNLLIAISLYIFPFNVHSVIASSDDSVSDDRHHRERGDYDTSRDDRGDIDDNDREHEREHEREDVDRDEHDRDRDDRDGDGDHDRDGSEREGDRGGEKDDKDDHDSIEKGSHHD
jgi:hypothetical protein